MTTDPAQGATWGEPSGPAAPGAPEAPAPAPKKGWSGRKTAIAAAVAVVIAVGGGLAIWAGTSSNNASAQQGPGGFGGPGGQGGPAGFGGRGGFGGGGAAALLNALHGDFVVTDASGGYTTERLQTGAITEISVTSVTLTSKDGYKQTYTLDASTRKTGTTPKTGDNVTVIAKLAGTTATATSLEETSAVQQRGGGFTGSQPGQGRRRYGN